MRILCYGASEPRLRTRCEFLQGAGCVGDWAPDLKMATSLLRHRRYDAAFVGPSLTVEERLALQEVVNAISPQTRIVQLGFQGRESATEGDITLELVDELCRLEMEERLLASSRSSAASTS